MPYELYNPQPCAIDCSLRAPFGTIRVMPNETLPTPEMEKRGITADLLEPFVLESFLHKTPPAVRRRLFRDEQLPIPEDLVAATAHLPEFGGAYAPVAEVPVLHPAPAPRDRTEHIYDAKPPVRRTPSLDEGMQQISDQLCSSTRIKHAVNP